eukprot:m.66698 g.66698  ORF g.66698 m.66698 type:complete len:59 (-) comp23715_c0_seq2:132-308(-)
MLRAPSGGSALNHYQAISLASPPPWTEQTSTTCEQVDLPWCRCARTYVVYPITAAAAA